MSGIRVTLDGGEVLERARKVLAGIPDGVSKAITSASKRSGEEARSKAGTFVAQKYTLSKGSFMAKTKQSLTVNNGFTLSFTGSVIGLNRYIARDRRPNGVFVHVKRSTGGGILPHAFRGPNDHIFERVGTPRLPIEKKTGPSGASLMKNDEIIELMEKTVTESFDKRMEVEINRLLAGF